MEENKKMKYDWYKKWEKGRLINEAGQEEEDENVQGLTKGTEPLSNNHQHFSFNLFSEEKKHRHR